MKIGNVARALADPTRLRVMRLLADMELAVGELAQILGQSQPRISRHVGILCDAGLAERRREGSWTFLRQTVSERSPRKLEAAVAQLLNAAEESDCAFAERCAEDRRHLAAIRANRENAAAEYFAVHAKEWDRLREMLGPAEKVEAALARALDGAPLGQMLDIGTGTGRIAELLADRADHIVALDKSPEMLRLARARLQNLPFEGWELVQSDFGALPFKAESFDTIVFHQVLHYAHEPASVLQEAARACRPGGRIVIADFAYHEREELRRNHAHVRLGFTDEQMLELLSESGFTPSSPVVVPGKELTTKIWAGVKAPEPGTKRRADLNRGAPA